QIDSNGLSIIGVGITIILYSYAIRVILDNDLSNKKLLKKIKQPLPKQEQIPDYKKLFNNEHPKIKYILYITIGLVVVSGIIAVLSVYGAYPFIDTIGFSFIFLTTAGAFNQLFVDKYERFVLNMEIERLLTFKSR
ncbi:MAG: hypothetical protein Q7U51_04150, partial [Methanoregula sp.]|nr:hypothetical protein [Methanoregula sp.]